MSDIDYYALFQNGQLVWKVKEHREILDRFYQAYKGFPEEAVFASKYKEYLAECRPESVKAPDVRAETVIIETPVEGAPTPEVISVVEAPAAVEPSENSSTVITEQPIESTNPAPRPKKSRRALAE